MSNNSFAPIDFLRRAWFPAALVLLLVLAIPGWVLFVLHLFGMEGQVNQWLEQNFQLSYQLALPWWGGLLLLFVPFLIVLLYFLKLKRKPIQVPSTFLWKKSIEDLHVNALLQWLRDNVLLLLQLLIILCLPYAVMSFRFHSKVSDGRHYIIMIDNSASMSARDVAPNRLEWAKDEALKEVAAAGDNDFGMVIVFNSSAQILQSRTNNRDLLAQSVKNITPTQRATRIDEALSLADSLANPSRSTDDNAVRPANEEPDKNRVYVEPTGTLTEVHLYSDGRFPETDFALGNLNVRLHSAGKPGAANQDNIGIVRLSGFRDEADPTRVQVFVRVINCRSTEAKARVQIDLQTAGKTEKAIYEKPILLPPRVIVRQEKKTAKAPSDKGPSDAPSGEDTAEVTDTPGEATLTFDLKELDDRADTVVHARLLDVKDSFPLDDQAWLVFGIVRKARILMVSKGNEVLDKFFTPDLLGELAVLERLKPDQLDSEDEYLKPARNGDFDLVIFDRCAPKREEDLPLANTFFIGHPPPGWKKPGAEGEGRDVEKITNPYIKGWMAKHPILRDLRGLHEIGIFEAFRLKDLPSRTPLLIEGDLETGLLVALSRQSYTDLVLAFPIINDKDEWNTNWPLRPSFPLFLHHILYTLGHVSDAVAEDNLQPGQVKTLLPDISVAELQVIDPTGAAHKLLRGTRAEFTFGSTDYVGIYRVAWNNKVQRSFAVNLLDSEESNLEPRQNVKIGEELVGGSASRLQPRILWKWIVLGALALLLLEWYVYNRRVYI